jgi:hypothetical protein
VQPPFGLVLCDRSPHQTSDTRLMDWLTLSSGTNASRDTHGDGAAFNRPGSARSARNSSPPHYDTDPKPAVPSLNDEPGCIKVVDTFRSQCCSPRRRVHSARPQAPPAMLRHPFPWPDPDRLLVSRLRGSTSTYRVQRCDRSPCLKDGPWAQPHPVARHRTIDWPSYECPAIASARAIAGASPNDRKASMAVIGNPHERTSACCSCALQSGCSGFGQPKPPGEWPIFGSVREKRTDRSPPIAAMDSETLDFRVA